MVIREETQKLIDSLDITTVRWEDAPHTFRFSTKYFTSVMEAFRKRDDAFPRILRLIRGVAMTDEILDAMKLEPVELDVLVFNSLPAKMRATLASDRFALVNGVWRLVKLVRMPAPDVRPVAKCEV